MLVKGEDSARAFTFLVDLDEKDVEPPLAQFNHTRPIREDIAKLLKTMNKTAEFPLKDAVLDSAFDAHWPKFKERFDRAIRENPAVENVPTRTSDEMLEEILATVRRLDRSIDPRNPRYSLFGGDKAAEQALDHLRDAISKAVDVKFGELRNLNGEPVANKKEAIDALYRDSHLDVESGKMSAIEKFLAEAEEKRRKGLS